VFSSRKQGNKYEQNIFLALGLFSIGSISLLLEGVISLIVNTNWKWERNKKLDYSVS
jgi:hypothetical protein